METHSVEVYVDSRVYEKLRALGGSLNSTVIAALDAWVEHVRGTPGGSLNGTSPRSAAFNRRAPSRMMRGIPCQIPGTTWDRVMELGGSPLEHAWDALNHYVKVRQLEPS